MQTIQLYFNDTYKKKKHEKKIYIYFLHCKEAKYRKHGIKISEVSDIQCF